MNEPDIPYAKAPACYACSPWPRYPVIGPALLVLVVVLFSLLLISNANAFNDVNAELQIAAREARVARQQAAERLAAQQRAAQAQAQAQAQAAAIRPARPDRMLASSRSSGDRSPVRSP